MAISQELSHQTPVIEQQTDPSLAERFRDTAMNLRGMLGKVAVVGVLAAGAIAANPSVASADTLGYPWASAPCEFAPSGGASCTNPSNPYDLYDWGETISGVFHPYRESGGYEYRNCTDYVAWKLESLGVAASTVNGLGNGGQWYSNAPSGERSSTPLPWDAAVVPGNPGHVAFVESVNTDGTITVSEYNHDTHGDGDTRTATASSMGFTEFVDFGVHPSGGSGSGPYPHGYIDTSAAIDAKSTPGWLNYTQEVGSGNATQFVMAGNYQMFLRGDGTVFAKNTMGPGGWVQETNAQGATAIAVSDTGLQLIIAPDAEVDSRSTIGGPGGWTQEVGPGNANAIALGGNNMMFLRGDDTVFAKTGAGGAWTQETLSGAATAIATGPSGLQLLIEPNGEVDSRTFPASFGGWTAETYPDSAEAITAG